MKESVKESMSVLKESINGLKESMSVLKESMISLKESQKLTSNANASNNDGSSVQISADDRNSIGRKLTRIMKSLYGKSLKEPDHRDDNFGSDSEDLEEDDPLSDVDSGQDRINETGVTMLCKQSGDSSKFGKKLVLMVFGDHRVRYSRSSSRCFPQVFSAFLNDCKKFFPKLNAETALKAAYNSCSDKRKSKVKKRSREETESKFDAFSKEARNYIATNEKVLF